MFASTAVGRARALAVAGLLVAAGVGSVPDPAGSAAAGSYPPPARGSYPPPARGSYRPPAPAPPVPPVSPLADDPVVRLGTTRLDVGGAADRADRATTTVNDNGGWCWFQDERSTFTSDGRLLVSTLADRDGTLGQLRNGANEVANLDLRTGRTWVDTLARNLVSDDHNAAALLELPNRRILAFATDHSTKPDIFRYHQDQPGLAWVADQPIRPPEAGVYDPALGRATGVTYSNLLFLAGEGTQGRTYDFYRSYGERPHLVTSDDLGSTWTPRGEVFSAYRAYTRFVGDGQGRIHVTVTDGHPTILGGTSLYHGYLEAGVWHRSDGTPVAPLGQAIHPSQLTLVQAGVSGGRDVEVAAWGSDIALDAEGRPVITFSTKVPGPSPVPGRSFRHDAGYARWDGTTWNVSRMGDAGSELYVDQPDYTGLSTIDPADPSQVFLSTNQHPASGAPLVSAADGRVHWELFHGRTADGGATWTWAAVTQGSTVDHIRPEVPQPRDGHQALVWLQGSYPDFLFYDLDVVAIVHPGDDPAAAVWSDEPGYGAPGQVPASTDLDGDGRDDLVLYGPGAAKETLVWSLADHRRRSRALTSVPGTAVPLTGDFDGDGLGDVFWYGPGTAPDPIWFSRADTWWDAGSRPVKGTYVPVTGDFDGDGRHDVLWYGPGAAPDSVWWGHPDRGFTSTRISVTATGLLPVAGDLDGDGRHDVFWYGPGALPDRVWWGRPDRRLGVSRSATSVTGRSYRPVAGDVDGDGYDEVVWYGPGATADSVWFGRADRAVGRDKATLDVGGELRPVTADLDGDGDDEVVWYDPVGGAVTLRAGRPR